MESKTISGLRLFYNSTDEKAAILIEEACERSVLMFSQRWGLETPADCRVYVLTSWLQFLFHSAPWPWKVYLCLTLPLIAKRAGKIWASSGGWALQYGQRKVVGVKPPRLIQAGDRGPGEQLFLQDRNIDEIVQTVACHELAHAHTFHLKLPVWLNEGLATLAMEHYLGRPIVREDTLKNLPGVPFGVGREKLGGNQQGFVSLYASGYWLSRHIDETRPELLRSLLARHHPQDELEEKIASAYGKSRDQFWMEIAGELKSRFGLDHSP